MSARSLDEVADLAAEELELELEDFEEEVEEGCAGSPNATAGGNAHCPMGSPYAVVSKLDKAHEDAPGAEAEVDTAEEFNTRPVKHSRGTRTTTLIDDLISQAGAGKDRKPSDGAARLKRKMLASPPAKSARKGGVDVARFAKGVAAELEEPKAALVRRAVDTLGVDLVTELVEQVRAIEAEGGQMIKGGERRRTPGGVFWNVLKEGADGRVSPAEYGHIFAEEKEAQKERVRRRQSRKNNQQQRVGGDSIDEAPASPTPSAWAGPSFKDTLLQAVKA